MQGYRIDRRIGSLPGVILRMEKKCASLDIIAAENRRRPPSRSSSVCRNRIEGLKGVGPFFLHSQGAARPSRELTGSLTGNLSENQEGSCRGLRFSTLVVRPR
jgi:hypothetical protein